MIAKRLRIDLAAREPALGGELRAFLLLLLQACEGCEGAEELDHAPGDLAPVRDEFASGGVAVTLTALRRAGGVELRADRCSRPTNRVRIAERGASCHLVLHPSGAEFLRAFLAGADGGAKGAADLPHWDGRLLQLWWRDVCIREYRHDAANQRLVLDAFEANHWPKRLDDPLPRERGVNVKVRLCETIKGLNRGQRPHQLRFRGDGTGLGVRWEPIG
jgi:hypothetical protein